MEKILLTLTTCSLLAACGGGGNTETASNNSNNSLVGAAITLSSTNYETAAKEIVGSVTGMQSSGTAVQGVLTGAQVTTLATPAMFLQAKLPELAQLSKRQASLTGAVISESIPCSSGRMDAAFNDKNNNNDLDTGDSAEITLNNCKLGNFTANGKMSFSVNSGSADAGNISLLATIQDFKVTFNDIVSVSNGSYTMTISSVDLTTATVDMQSPSLTNQITQAGNTKVFQYKDYSLSGTTSLNASSWAVKGTVTVPTLGANSASIDTITRFSKPNSLGYATTGQLMITVSNGGKMRVSATGTSNAKVELDLNSDGIYEEFKLTPWIDIL